MAPQGALIDAHRNGAYFCGCEQSPLINSEPSRLNCISGRHRGWQHEGHSMCRRKEEGTWYVGYPPSLRCVREVHIVRHLPDTNFT